ncbi:MAG TPA: alpha/beta hydrolase-fold protein [Gemmatimonadaceae bacterium]
MQRYNRRQFLEIAAAGTGAFAVACNLDVPAPKQFTQADATIVVRPFAPTLNPFPAGYNALGLTTPRDGFVYVPTTYDPNVPAPLMVLLHGNGSGAQFWDDYGIGELLDDLGIVILAPDSRGVDWDIITQNAYVTDPAYINFALNYTFKHINVNPTRVAMAGFSDGGIESLGVGIANGDLFTHVMAYSPGALIAPFQQGKPKCFISHGQADTQLSFEFDRDNIAGKLTQNAYDVTFVPFNGGHEVPTDIARQSATWFLA